MKTRSRLLAVYLIGGIAGLLIVISGILFVYNFPAIEQLLPPNSAPILITFNTPESNTKWPSNASIPIFASAMSEKPIASLEFLADGRLMETFNPESGASTTHFYLQTNWSPITAGSHSLVVRATDTNGRVTTSNVITIEATEPVGFNMLITAKEGDTTQDLAKTLGVSEQEILQQNPGLASAGAIPGGQSVSIRRPPVTVPAPQPPPQTTQPSRPIAPVSMGNRPSDFLFWINRYISPTTSMPVAPQLSYSVENGELYLQFNDLSSNEDGFFIYRANPDSGVNERIAILEPNKPTYSMKLTNSGGSRENYFVSAFNIAGESPSNLVSLDPDDPSLSLPNNGLKFEDGKLILPKPVEKVYFYTSLNKEPYQRFPPDITSFITPTNNTVPFALLNAPPQDTQLLTQAVDLQGWGWFGSSLIELGEYHTAFGNTNLKMCNLGKNCYGDQFGFRVTHGLIWSDGPNQDYEFYWDTAAPGATSALWQISLAPFPEGFQPDPPNLIAGGCVTGGKGGTFLVDFSKSLNQYSPPPNCGGWAPLIEMSSITGITPPTTLYMRVTPMAGNQPAAKPSNMVEIEYKPNKTPPFVLPTHLPPIYKIEIVDYQPVRFAQKDHWGCVYIKSLDFAAIKAYYKSELDKKGWPYSDMSEDLSTKAAEQWMAFLYPALLNQWLICPEDAEEPSLLTELLSFAWEGIKGFWSAVVQVFDTIKGGIVDGVASIVGCEGDCKTWLRRGLEMGFTAMTGIPPNLPTFDSLTEMGIKYTIELAASQAGISCGEDCRQLIHDGLKSAIETVTQQKSQPGCVSAGQAEGMGKKPLCLPPGVTTEADLDGVYQPATARLRVSNISQHSEKGSYGDKPAYSITVKATSRNNNLIGKSLYYPYLYETSYYDSFSQSWQRRSEPVMVVVPINRELFSVVFKSASIPIPELQPGAAIDIPVVLEQAIGVEYLIQEHIMALHETLRQRNLSLDDVGGYDGNRGYMWFDWGCMYHSGLIKIEANLMCLSTQPGQVTAGPNSQLVSCEASAFPWVQREPSDTCVP